MTTMPRPPVPAAPPPGLGRRLSDWLAERIVLGLLYVGLAVCRIVDLCYRLKRYDDRD